MYNFTIRIQRVRYLGEIRSPPPFPMLIRLSTEYSCTVTVLYIHSILQYTYYSAPPVNGQCTDHFKRRHCGFRQVVNQHVSL